MGSKKRPMGSALVDVMPATEAVPMAKEERPRVKQIFFFMRDYLT